MLSTVVQSADCERIFKDWARFHTNTRNRLHLDTTNKLVQVRKFQLRASAGIVSNRGVAVNRVIMPTELVQVVDPKIVEMGESEDSEDAVEQDEQNSDHAGFDQDPDEILRQWIQRVEEANCCDTDEDEEEIDFGMVQIPDCHVQEPSETAEQQLPPFPNVNDPRFPQEILRKLPQWNLRTKKETLCNWFANDIDLK